MWLRLGGELAQCMCDCCALALLVQIDERCREKLIAVETAQMAVADLDRYYKGLDKVWHSAWHRPRVVAVHDARHRAIVDFLGADLRR